MFNPGQANSRPSGLYHSPSTNDLRSKRGVFTNAGLSTLSGQDDSIQHNYRYQVDREKIRRDAEAAELNKLKRFQSEANYQTLSNVHPNAYKSYANNLDKIGVGLDQADAYVNEVQSAKERLFQDQQNMLSLQKLNRLNAEQHKQHLQRQMNRIRDPVRENDFPPFRPAVNTKSVDSVGSRNYINDTEQDLKLSLLDKFSLNNGLEDQLSSFAPNSGGLTGRSNTGLDNSRDYGDMSRYMGATTGTRAPTSSFRPREVREPVQQYSPYLPSPGYNQPPPQQYYPVPGYGGYNAPPPSSENLEMKVYMQKQTDLLERISDKLAKRKAESKEKPRRDTRDFEHRFRDFEKETELRMQLMKQQQTIENLQTQTTQPRQKQTESRQSRYRNNDEPKSNNPPGHYHSQSQPDIFNPQNLVQSFMQHMNPFGGYNPANPTNNPLVNSLMFPQGYDPYMNPYAYGMYPDQMYSPFSPYGYSAGIKDKKKKRKKSKKRTKADSDDSDSDKLDSDDSDDDSTGKSRRRSKSSKKKKDNKKDKDNKDKKSKDRKGSKKGGDGDEDEIPPEDKKKKARSNLRTILWTIAYQKIFVTDISQKVTNRRAAHQQDIYNRLDPIAQNFATWLMNVAQEGFTKLFDDVKKTYDFVGLDFKKPSRSDVVKRAAEAKKQTKVLIETLIAKTDANPIDNNNLEFLTGVCYKNVYLSDNTFSVFELMRIKSNAWGRIIDLTPQHSQMILSCILIVRLLAFQLVFKANEWNNKVKWTPQALANFKIVGSLLYRITVSMWEEILPVVTEKPSQLGCVPLPPLTLDPILAPVDDTPDNPEMIFGTISKTQLAPVLEEDKPWTDSMKQLIFSWTANIYNKIDAYRMQNPAKEPQLAGGEGLMAGMANQAASH